jgi:predicted nucleic acid-binding protein
MPDIFADTAGWGHIADPSQPYHSLASAIYNRIQQQGDKLVTTNYVITELVALMRSPLRMPRPTIIAFIEGLKASPYIEVVHVDVESDRLAWELLAKRPDKPWSLVDCASFVVMQQRGMSQALTTDHHFEQAGFMCLLKS